MPLPDSRNIRPVHFAIAGMLLLTPVAFYLCTRGLADQGRTGTFESTDGSLVAQGESLAYTYRVEGQDFVGTRESFLRGGETVKPNPDLKAGSSVRVYYDPMNPKSAVLSPGTPLSAFSMAGLATVGMPGCAAGLWFYTRRSGKQASYPVANRFETFSPGSTFREAA